MNKSTTNDFTQQSKPKLIANEMLLPFILVAILFPLWGFANDVTNPLVKAFKDIFLITNAQSSLVQFAFYLGYGIMAIPAAIFYPQIFLQVWYFAGFSSLCTWRTAFYTCQHENGVQFFPCRSLHTNLWLGASRNHSESLYFINGRQ